MRKAAAVLLAFFPSPLKVWILNTFFQASIHPSARIGLSIIHAKKIIIGPKAQIGHFNAITNLDLFEIGAEASINAFNRISGPPIQEGRSCFMLGRKANVAQWHYFDCSDTIKIGDHTNIGGLHSIIFTHGKNRKTNIEETSAVTIGHHCLVSAHSVLIKGCVLPDCSILGANSTLHKAFTETHTLYSGVPAVAINKMQPSWAVFAES